VYKCVDILAPLLPHSEQFPLAAMVDGAKASDFHR